MANNYWDTYNQTIYSDIGHWQGGVDVTIEGYSLMHDLMGNISYIQLHVLNATGKLIKPNVAQWIEVCFMGLSYPDSRIWCNQLASYAADTHASVVAAASAAILGADSRGYGGSQARKVGMTFLIKAYEKYQLDLSWEEIISHARYKQNKPIIVGFARPIDKADERLEPFSRVQKELGIPQGEYLRFALALSEYLKEHYDFSINCGGYASAFFLDQGFSPEEAYKISTFAVVSGAIACYRNFEHSPANSFLPLKCEDIEYTGPKIRSLED